MTEEAKAEEEKVPETFPIFALAQKRSELLNEACPNKDKATTEAAKESPRTSQGSQRRLIQPLWKELAG